MSSIDDVIKRLGIVVDPEAVKQSAVDALAQLARDLLTLREPEDRAAAVGELISNPRILADLADLHTDGPAWTAATMAARSVRGCSGLIRDLERAVKAHRRAGIGLSVVGKASDLGFEPLPDELPEGYRIPPGWLVRRNGIYRVESNDGADTARMVAHAPMYVVGRMIDADSGAHQLRLAWYGDHGQWMERIVYRSTAADARALVKLADDGAPVTSGNSGEIVAYLAACASFNGSVLPGEMSLGRCGWADGGFLLGTEWIGEHGKQKTMHADDGVSALVNGCTCAGTWDGWASTMQAVADRPYPWLAMWGAVASLMLQPLGIRMGFVLDFSGPTSTGKSSILEAGIAVAGPPRGALFATWSGTLAGIEARFYTLQNVVVALDDTKEAANPAVISDVIYMAANGTGKIRGAPSDRHSPVAMRRSARWLAGLLMTGEQRATAYSRDEGAAARTISLEDMPFGGRGPEYRRRAVALTRGLREHHGHLARRVIPWLLDPANVAQAQAWLDEEIDRYTEPLAALGAVQGRVGETLALIAAASRVCAAVGAPEPMWAICDPLADAYRACAGAGTDADQARVALDRLHSMARQKRGQFLSRFDNESKERDQQPAGGWLGRWDAGADWRYLDIYPHVVEDELRRADFAVDAVTKAWADRGWIQTTHGRRCRFKDGGELVTVYRFHRWAVDGEEGPPE